MCISNLCVDTEYWPQRQRRPTIIQISRYLYVLLSIRTNGVPKIRTVIDLKAINNSKPSSWFLNLTQQPNPNEAAGVPPDAKALRRQLDR